MELGYSEENLNGELFASDKQHVLDLYCSKGKKIAATNFTGPLSGRPTETPGSVNWGRS